MFQKDTTDFSKLDTTKSYSKELVDTQAERSLILQMLGDIRKKKILDVGCGNGSFSLEMQKKGAKVIGIDISEAFILYANEKYGSHITFHKFNAKELDTFTENEFDFIILSNVLPNISRLNEIKKIIEGCRSVLNKNGKLFLSIVNPDSIKNSCKDSVRRIHLSCEKKILKSGDKYSAEYLLTDGTWIKFSDIFWESDCIHNLLEKNGFSIIKEILQTPHKNQVPNIYLEDYKRTPIRYFFLASTVPQHNTTIKKNEQENELNSKRL